MRQDDGSELLGANDPRSATIGVIHVAPNDDRQSVLAAILTQDKLGRKQVAVVLPEENRAFQRPVDFDGLKNMRRGLKAQIVFVAPAGPGPAEFARQRRFPVYSSLESYARAIKAEGEGSTVIKRGWGFGRRQKPVGPEATLPPLPAPANGIEYESTHPLPARSAVPSEQVSTGNDAQANGDNEPNHSGRNAALLGGAGLVAGLGLGALAAGEHGQGSFIPPYDEDWDELPTPPAGTHIVGTAHSSNAPMQADAEPREPQSATPSGTGSTAGPGIIAFPPPQKRITGKLPPVPAVVPVSAAQPHPPAIQSTGRRRNSGKMAAVGAAGAAGVAIGAGAAMAAHGTGVGAPPPPTRAGAVGGGGAGAARRRNRRRLLALALILLTLLLIGGIALASPGGLGSHIFPVTPGATVTITPANSDVSETYSIDAVPGGPTGKSQVAAHLLSSPQSKSGTVNATGTGVTPATQATGTLTFYNALGPSKTITAGTIITGTDGVQVINDVAAVIPAANPPMEGFVTVAAHAVKAGASGNIAALDVNEPCCATNVIVRNTAAFSGGQDPQPFTAVSQKDLDGFATSTLKTSLLAAAKADVTKQQGSEQLVAPVSCPPASVSSNPQVGQRATTAMVTVTVTCSAESYDQAAAVGLAQASLMSKAGQNPGAGYALVGNILTMVTQANVVDSKGTVSLLIFAKGRWAYQFKDPQSLADKIVGPPAQTTQMAISTLLGQLGVSNKPGQAPTIVISGGGNLLPTDPSQIKIVVQMVPGIPVTPTTGSGTPTSPGSTATSGTSMTPTPTPTPITGLGGS